MEAQQTIESYGNKTRTTTDNSSEPKRKNRLHLIGKIKRNLERIIIEKERTVLSQIVEK